MDATSFKFGHQERIFWQGENFFLPRVRKERRRLVSYHERESPGPHIDVLDSLVDALEQGGGAAGDPQTLALCERYDVLDTCRPVKEKLSAVFDLIPSRDHSFDCIRPMLLEVGQV